MKIDLTSHLLGTIAIRDDNNHFGALGESHPFPNTHSIESRAEIFSVLHDSANAGERGSDGSSLAGILGSDALRIGSTLVEFSTIDGHWNV
jgi:hypothetical protein